MVLQFHYGLWYANNELVNGVNLNQLLIGLLIYIYIINGISGIVNPQTELS